MAPYDRRRWGTTWHSDPPEERGPVSREELQEGTMTSAQTGENMSPRLLKVAERAKMDPTAQFHSLAHLIDVEALERAYHRLRKNAAVGVDGITKEEYGQALESNLRDLHGRLKAKRYRHQPIRRVHVPKAPGKTRPIGVACIEDKVVQGATREVLEAIYEQDFLPCSYGFRPKRSPHDALRDLDRMVMREGMQWILETDVQTFFDSLDRSKLREMLRIRVQDGSLLRLIGKCLHVGVLDGEEYAEPDTGTVQGSSISPLLGNVYLHYALDLWFENEARPRLRGRARLIRFADDLVVGFERKEDAEWVLGEMTRHLAEYGLALHPDKTRILPFHRPSAKQGGGKGPATFDFLGFTLFWRKSRRGRWVLGMKTQRARLRRAFMALNDWCRRHMHRPKKEQYAALCRQIRGHFNYFGVNGNTRSLSTLIDKVRRVWLRWLRRRSHKARALTWERLSRYLAMFPLPAPRVCVQIWGRSP